MGSPMKYLFFCFQLLTVGNCISPNFTVAQNSKGGMFGYSTAISNPIFNINSTAHTNSTQQLNQRPWMYFVASQPWDAAVYIYAAKTPSINITTSDYSDNSTLATPFNIEWNFIQSLHDGGNGTWPSRSYSLFGYSVSISEDGQWIAVGIPGRTYTPVTRFVSLQFHSYSGAVRIYRLLKQHEDTPGSFQFVQEIKNPNGNAFWQKFGDKVVIKAINDSNYALVVSANGGWDGASTKYYQAGVDSPDWPIDPRNVVGSGLYVYTISDMHYKLGNKNQIVTMNHFLPQQSPVPMGSLGIEFDFIITGNAQIRLFVRDFVLPPQYSADYASLCPHKNCSFLQLDNVLINSTDAVLCYTIENGQLVQTRSTVIFLKSDFNNFGIKPTGWDKNDWFGSAISVQYDPLYDRYVLAVGAPRFSIGIYTYHSNDNMNTWQPSGIIPNPSNNPASFFGQKIKFSSDAKFLIVSDPVDSSSGKGGSTSIYHRRSEYERLPDFPNFFEQPSFDKIKYDFLASFEHSGQISDQFGFALGLNPYVLLVGAHVQDTVYSYLMPRVKELGKPPPVVPPSVDPGVRPAPSPSPESPVSLLTPSNGWKVGVIVGICGLVIGLAVFVGMYRYHKLQVIRALQDKELLYSTQKDFDATKLGTESVSGSHEPIIAS